MSWATVWAAVVRHGAARVEDPERVGPTTMVGFDETVMQPARRRRRRRFVTAVVDVGTGQVLDVFEGRDAKDLRAWMAAMPAAWLAQIQVVSVDRHEGWYFGEKPPGLGTDVHILGSCEEGCNTSRYNLHLRYVYRRGNVVSVFYTFGDQLSSGEEQVYYLAKHVADRMAW